MTTSERRIARRFKVRIPLRFHRLNTLSERDQGENSINISSSGIYFTTNLPLSVGEAVEVLLKMPKRITGIRGVERCFTGWVTHIESTKLPEGYSGVGVQLLCY
jgi:PilZ domain